MARPQPSQGDASGVPGLFAKRVERKKAARASLLCRLSVNDKRDGSLAGYRCFQHVASEVSSLKLGFEISGMCETLAN